MKPRLRFKRIAETGMVGAALLLLAGCAAVKPYEREKLADPIMDPASHFGKQTLEQKFFSTREGSIGGGTGVGGGCGCAK
jgi:Domain of unknown function (DUF4266)